MRVAVVAPEAVPAASGGAERLCDGLVDALHASGHESSLVRLPSPERSFRDLVESYAAFGGLDLLGYDRVISTKYPSWMVRHPDHTVYMLHPLRGLYDTYQLFGLPSELPDMGVAGRGLKSALAAPFGSKSAWVEVIDEARHFLGQVGDEDPLCLFPGPAIRALVHWLDRDALSPVNIRKYAAISSTVANRAGYFPDSAKVQVVLPPTNLHGLRPGPFTSFFTASRLDAPKRIELVIAAMEYVAGDVELRIAGSGPEEPRLKAVRPRDKRIKFLGRLPESDLIEEYSRAIAVPFIPLDEDFGLVALEAQLAAKPVITTADSGGVRELVIDGVNGRVVEPDPVALGAAMNELAHSLGYAERLGGHGLESARKISWDQVAGAIMNRSPSDERSGLRIRKRPKLIMMSTYAAFPAYHGGQIRVSRLAQGLAQRFEIEYIALEHSVTSSEVSEPFPGIRQTLVPRSPEHVRLEGEMASRSPIPVGDIAASAFGRHSGALLSAIQRESRGAVGVVFEHPYLLPVGLEASGGLPFVYDAHNVETSMKAAMLHGGVASEQMLAIVRTVERAAVRGAELVAACSSEDAQALKDMAPTLADWALVPNGADVLSTPFVTGNERASRRKQWLTRLSDYVATPARHVAVFVGSYHRPNLDAADFIARRAHLLPDVSFILAGSLGLYFKNWRLPKNVVVTGQITHSELQAILSVANVGLNPILSGGGTNLKLIQYFASGVPVVSTLHGTRGARLRDGVELRVAEPDGFMSAVAEVIGDSAGADARAQEARKVAEEHYDWSPISDNYAMAVAGALGLEI